MPRALEKRDAPAEFSKEAKLTDRDNSNSGEDGFNKSGKAAKLNEGQIEGIIDEFNRLVHQTNLSRDWMVSNIF